MMKTTGFASKERVVVADMIQAYCVENIKRYDHMKNKLKLVRAQLVRPVSGLSERDRVFDQRHDSCYEAVKRRILRR